MRCRFGLEALLPVHVRQCIWAFSPVDATCSLLKDDPRRRLMFCAFPDVPLFLRTRRGFFHFVLLLFAWSAGEVCVSGSDGSGRHESMCSFRSANELVQTFKVPDSSYMSSAYD
ncbi:unnamed protein product [Prorocentrum cordatum]|uniref:Secreted protein n=1 Tax=Prorocentrum cordatum TaxID=2364126 RepID=A0ABN9TW18_9DINO|nr:unnamed protein product [Polarella glacialis]